MKKLNQEFVLLSSALNSKKGRLAILIGAIVLFILSAAAPNATIGIGK